MRERKRVKARSKPPADPTVDPKTPPASPEQVVRRLIEQTPGVAEPQAPQPLADPRMQGPATGPVRILFMDLDGTLTDGVITFDAKGDHRHFFIRDGLALHWAKELGILPVVISGRSSKAAERRMEDLELEFYFGVKDKVAAAEAVLKREGATWEQCVMVGDDLPDVALMKKVGWPIAVTDAVPEAKAVARTVTLARAGFGAVREVVERVLKHNGLWQRVLDRYDAR
jgi:3-deoxy-D-manno-octulosonate 8-phosphate phosphatase (KDO 8-P phosphatase)